MSTTSSITRRRRILALAGVAIITAPLLIGTVMKIGQAYAFANPVEQATQSIRSFADIVAADKPAVVTITTKIAQANGSPDAPQFGPGSPYDEFFRQFFGNNGPMPQPMRSRPGGQVVEALGSGFTIGSEGTIVTNNHVIDGAGEIKVTLDDGQDFAAKLVGRDAKTDLAVLKIEAGKPLPTIAWGDSHKLRAGDGILAIGNPFGIGTTVTSGIVSARGRDLHNGPYDDFIQVDAAVNHGNSGGPLVDIYSKVVGINTAIYSPNGGNVGVGFAIPSDQAEKIVARLMRDGSIEHGYIGVQIQPMTKAVANALGLGRAEGALVSDVFPDSPASHAGLKTGDVVTTFGGKPVASPDDLLRLVADVAPDTTNKVTIWRGDKQINLSVTIGGSADEKRAVLN